MGFHSNKLTFKTDEITNEIRQPQIFLCDRQLNTLGEISPVNNLRIKCSLNGADEISFQTPKDVRTYNDSDLKEINKITTNRIPREGNRLYSQLKDYSIILAPGFGYFEVSPSISDSDTETKSVSGTSLGEAELSQLLCTLECNTEDDIKYSEGDNYIPTILYDPDPDNKKHSLIHRILSYAPNYTVGHVDDTIKNIQRTFSFSKTDILSCFSQIAEEIGCIFDVSVKKDDEGTVLRQVNIYDAQYCGNCNKRNIINGICQDCGSTDIRGIGEDTTIEISTDNLSDEITVSSDGNMKNCFIVEGGDDIVTSTVEGIMPSGNNKLYKFSEETRRSFSPELRAAYEKYEKNYEENKESYAETLELEYGIFDLILYLQSGRMPTVQTAKRNLYDETIHVIHQFQTLFPKGLGTLDLDATKLRNSTVRQVFSLFVDDGYAVKADGEMNKEGGKLYWTGDIVVYEIGNNASKATICVRKDSSYIEWLDGTRSDGELSSSGESDKSDDPETKINLSNWGINFTTDDGEYETYLKQKIAITQKNYEYIEDQKFNNPKEWQRYSLNRLYSYYSGYESCIEVLYEAQKESSLPGIDSTTKNMITSYQERMKEISKYMSHLEEMIYYLYFYYDQDFDSPASSAPSGQDIDYAKYNDSKNIKHFADASTAFENMVHYIEWGTWAGGEEKETTDHPLYCKDCGSEYVTLLNCLNPGCNSTNIVTYSTLAKRIKDAYQEDPTSLEVKRKEIRKKCDIKSEENLGSKLYSELCSFIREDIYTNSNFISDGLSNSALIAKSKELIEKANHELAKACVSQHTLSGNVHAFVAYSTLDKNDFPIQNAYDKFKLGNFMRYFSDKDEYKLRLSSEEFIWSDSGAELNVEFTDIIRYSDGGISDIASLVQAVGNLSTSFDSVKKQAEQGVEVKNTFEMIKNEGLNSALGNVLSARNQDVQITDEGITLRKYDYELDGYDDHQMKLINRNIVTTDDNWKTAKMAIGLGQYNGEARYGVWADVLVGNLIAGEKLIISNNEDTSKATVTIDGEGIDITNGSICMKNDESDVSVEINPEINDVFTISRKNEKVFGLDDEGNAFFNGKVNATGFFGGEINAEKGNVGSWEIIEGSLVNGYPDNGGLGNGMNVNGNGISAYKRHFAPIEYGNKKRMVKLQADTNEISFTKYVDTKNDGEIDSTKFSKFYVGNGTSYTADPVYMELSYPDNSSFIVDENGLQLSFQDNENLVINKDGATFYKGLTVNEGDVNIHNNLSVSGSMTGGTWQHSDNSSYGIHWSSTNTLRPVSESYKPNLGSTSIPFNNIYATNIYATKLYENGEELSSKYGVVSMRTVEDYGAGGWKSYNVLFYTTYKYKPFINIIGRSKSIDHAINFLDFIGDSTSGYTGMTFEVYTPNTSYYYIFQWFAIGNTI